MRLAYWTVQYLALALAFPAVAAPIVAICTVGIQSGDFQCYDTAFESPLYLDCTDSAAPPIGQGSERGSGVITWGSGNGASRFALNGRAVYEWSGRQAQGGGVVFAVVGVDEGRIFGDGIDRQCSAGRF